MMDPSRIILFIKRAFFWAEVRFLLLIHRKFFRNEERSFPTERQIPPDSPRFRVGQRVSLVLNKGPEGQLFATEVKLLDEDI